MRKKKTSLRKLTSSKSFTLVEVLIIIAIMGVLAAGVLAAVNPLKGINKSKDSKIKSDISQIAGAMQAYYTNTAISGASHYPAAIAELVESGELKTEPKVDGGSYSLTRKPDLCSTDGPLFCTDVFVYFPLNDPAEAGNVWCWRSDVGTFVESTNSLQSNSFCKEIIPCDEELCEI